MQRCTLLHHLLLYCFQGHCASEGWYRALPSASGVHEDVRDLEPYGRLPTGGEGGLGGGDGLKFGGGAGGRGGTRVVVKYTSPAQCIPKPTANPSRGRPVRRRSYWDREKEMDKAPI